MLIVGSSYIPIMPLGGGGPPNICPYVTQGFGGFQVGSLCHRASTPSFCVWGYCHELFKAYFHDGRMDLRSPSIYRKIGSDYSPYSSCPKPSSINPYTLTSLNPNPGTLCERLGFSVFVLDGSTAVAKRLDLAPGTVWMYLCWVYMV